MINTVTGTITSRDLGKTLMHEHLFVQFGGVSAEYTVSGQSFKYCTEKCIDYAEKIKGFGVRSIVDPTTVDLGRNPEMLAEIARKSGLNIICCTGIYSIKHYLEVLEKLADGPEAVADIFIKELTEGINDTGIRAGAIKVVTSGSSISSMEKELLLAAARASVETHAPVITHTEGILGDEQQRILTAAGVPASRIMIGHCCISTDFNYHLSIAGKGSFLGFDQFGMETIRADEMRVESISRLIHSGYVSNIMVSHDSVWCWVGGAEIGVGVYKNWTPVNFFNRILPMLHYAGISDKEIEKMLVDNPKQFFSS